MKKRWEIQLDQEFDYIPGKPDAGGYNIERGDKTYLPEMTYPNNGDVIPENEKIPKNQENDIIKHNKDKIFDIKIEF